MWLVHGMFQKNPNIENGAKTCKNISKDAVNVIWKSNFIQMTYHPELVKLVIIWFIKKLTASHFSMQL